MNVYKITYCDCEDTSAFRSSESFDNLVKEYDLQLLAGRIVSHITQRTTSRGTIAVSPIHQMFVVANTPQEATDALFASQICFSENPIALEIKLISYGVISHEYKSFRVADSWLEAE